MKRIVCLLLAAGYGFAAYAQDDVRRVHLGVNLKGGKMKESIALMPTNWTYPDALNNKASEIKVENDNSYGAEFQLGYFFGKKAKWGIGTGLVYLQNNGVLTLDSMHFEYRSRDFRGDIFRQLITTTRPIREELKTTNISIPIVLKYRTMFSNRVGLTVDAGIVYNVQTKSTYSATAAFNYEAIYKFEQRGNDYVAVYDNSSIPDPKSWLITLDEYNKDKKGDGNHEEYFGKLIEEGYNVGLNKAAASSGEVTHKSGSIGVVFQPSLVFKLTDLLSVNIGGYYMVQNIRNADEDVKVFLTDKMGEYNSVLHNNIRRRQQNYGANIGLSLSF